MPYVNRAEVVAQLARAFPFMHFYGHRREVRGYIREGAARGTLLVDLDAKPFRVYHTDVPGMMEEGDDLEAAVRRLGRRTVRHHHIVAAGWARRFPEEK